MHFGDEKAALGAKDTLWQKLHKATIESAIPQEPGWFTVGVLGTGDDYSISGLFQARAGHRLILENGWTYEKVGDALGLVAISGEKRTPTDPIKIGELYTGIDFGFHARRYGDGLETCVQLAIEALKQHSEVEPPHEP